MRCNSDIKARLVWICLRLAVLTHDPAVVVDENPQSLVHVIRDHVRALEIGAFAEEHGVTQRLRFNVDLDVTRETPLDDGDVESVVSYDVIIDAIHTLAEGPRINLLETFAERLAERLFSDPRVAAATIRPDDRP